MDFIFAIHEGFNVSLLCAIPITQLTKSVGIGKGQIRSAFLHCALQRRRQTLKLPGMRPLYSIAPVGQRIALQRQGQHIRSVIEHEIAHHQIKA